jgi:hypothetical protein
MTLCTPYGPTSRPLRQPRRRHPGFLSSSSVAAIFASVRTRN